MQTTPEEPKVEECYFCGAPATSREHVPPKCIFPERKDVSGLDFRKNLWTVPSCIEHNLLKSSDDEFLLACIAPLIGNNFLGYYHTKTKVARADDHHKGRLIDSVVRDRSTIYSVDSDGVAMPTLVATPDMNRVHRILEHVARGLWHVARGSRFVGRCVVAPDFVSNYKDGKATEADAQRWLGRMLVQQERQSWETFGSNPAVFSFQIGPKDRYGYIPMAMTFFEKSEVYVSFGPKGRCVSLEKIQKIVKESPMLIKFTITKWPDDPA